MEIKYKIEEVKPNIFAVIIENQYDRAMTFCRAQEYYESPNPKFRGKTFDMFDYMKWYSEEYGKGFSYGSDWSGFNIPLKTAWECYFKLKEYQTPYDEVMYKIVSSIEGRMFNKRNTRNWRGYIIGAGNTDGWTFKHEVCHGLWNTNKEYQSMAKDVITTIDKEHYNIFKDNLIKMGYTDSVIDDEIQAYLCFGHDNENFCGGVDITIVDKYHKAFLITLNGFIK